MVLQGFVGPRSHRETLPSKGCLLRQWEGNEQALKKQVVAKSYSLKGKISRALEGGLTLSV